MPNTEVTIAKNLFCPIGKTPHNMETMLIIFHDWTGDVHFKTWENVVRAKAIVIYTFCFLDHAEMAAVRGIRVRRPALLQE